MFHTDEQQAILNGSKGETMAKVMKTLVMYGETFGADKLVPVTSEYNHLVTSFGLKMMKPVFDLMQQLIDAGAVSQQKFSVDPRPLDKNVPANLLQKLIFNKFMYATQESYEKQLQKLGLMNEDAFTCACYLDQVGNKPKKGISSAGQSPLLWFTPTPFLAPGATATPALWILWVLSPVLFPTSACSPTRAVRLPGL